MKKSLLFTLLVGLLSFGLVGCSSNGPQEEKPAENITANTAAPADATADEDGPAPAAEMDEKEIMDAKEIKKIQEKGELVLATCADYPPFEWHHMVDGKDEIIGTDLEIAQAIADEIGVKLVVKDLDFDAIIPSLVSGQADIALAGLTYTPDRDQVVDFSDMYVQNANIVVVKKDKAEEYKTLEDFAGKKVGAQTGSSQEEIAKEKFPSDVDVLSLSKINNLIMEVKNGTADGVVLIDRSAEQYLVQNPDLAIIDIGIPSENGTRIAVPDGQKGLLGLCNKVLGQLSKDGKIDQWMDEFSAMAEEGQDL